MAYRTETEASLVSSKKGHRKSRHGCLCCKSRKVKCDEARPSCANCVRFGIPCHFPNKEGKDDTQAVGLVLPPQVKSGIRERGRGRPRRNWAALFSSATNDKPPVNLPTILHTPPPLPQIPCALPSHSSQNLTLNIAQAELLHQFVLFTGPSLAGTDSLDDPIAQFWAHNAPKLGFAFSSILYLSLALSAYHLAHMGTGDDMSHARYRSLAQLYNARGLAELNKELPNIDNNNCGHLYLAATLLCLNTFAAGPTSSSDLLICDSIDGPVERCMWVSLATGVRLIRMNFSNSVLFSGLLEPLGPKEDPLPSIPDSWSTCATEGFDWIDWSSPLTELREFVATDPINSDVDSTSTTCLSALEGVRQVYEATYGDEHGKYTGPPERKLVLIWLYMMEDTYVSLVRNGDLKALLILAYYAPLLKTIRRSWFLNGWAKHIITSVHAIIPESYRHWLTWPTLVEASMEFY